MTNDKAVSVLVVTFGATMQSLDAANQPGFAPVRLYPGLALRNMMTFRMMTAGT